MHQHHTSRNPTLTQEGVGLRRVRDIKPLGNLWVDQTSLHQSYQPPQVGHEGVAAAHNFNLLKDRQGRVKLDWPRLHVAHSD